MDTSEPDIEPVGQDYIEELKSEDGKFQLHNNFVKKMFLSLINLLHFEM